MEWFEILEQLGNSYLLKGKGAYSKVYKVRRKSDLKVFAIKQVNMSTLKDKEKDNALKEASMLA